MFKTRGLAMVKAASMTRACRVNLTSVLIESVIALLASEHPTAAIGDSTNHECHK